MLDLSRFPEAIRYEGGISRRLFLAYAASLSAVPWLGSRASGQTRNVSFTANPFSLGVASGDPTDRGIVLWTRLAPQPFDPHGGLSPENIEVSWEVADDESMNRVVRRGTEIASPQLNHSVHAEVGGLQPDRWYWYRFRCGAAESPIARTRTLPAKDAMPEQLRFAFASCQHFEQGLYTAYEHMAKDELDLVFHLGDYIYEYAAREDRVRKHIGGQCKTLADYRIRHSQYRADPLLQAIHARCPWIVTWDDHEVQDNYANDRPNKDDVDPVEFLLRRANAYQAYYEMMPLRRRSLPKGPEMLLYRKFPFGQLAEFYVLDTRQYRTKQPNGGRRGELNEAALSPQNTILGDRQRGWLEGSLLESLATWNVLAQQVMMAMVDVLPGESREFWMDQWPGYADERMKFVNFLEERRVPNPVVLTGDYHANWVNDVRVDDRETTTPIVATEFVGTSISSGGPGRREPRNLEAILAENPGVRFHNAERGYVRCTLSRKEWRSDYQVVENTTEPGAGAVTRQSFVVEAGQPGAKLA